MVGLFIYILTNKLAVFNIERKKVKNVIFIIDIHLVIFSDDVVAIKNNDISIMAKIYESIKLRHVFTF